MSSCPPLESLERLLEGQLAESHAGSIRDHLQNCSQCQAELDRLSGGDELETRRSARSVGRMKMASDEGLALDQVSRSTTFDMQAPDSTGSASVLAPPVRAGDLGSIGPYRVRAELGRGGMGIVYSAIDPGLERAVALKVMRPGHVHERSRDRFVREAKAAARVKHPNVVTVHAVANPPDGSPYLVMELVQGQTLRARVTRDKRLDAREAAHIIAEVADGLSAAHAVGLIHRDIKPSNIMLTVRGRPILMDFGLARFDDVPSQLTQDGVLAGTPCYMSPEQARHPQSVDQRTDIYSLGVTLYESLTGVVPFEGTTQMVLRQIESAEPRSPRQLNDAVPRDLETICLKAMAKEPARRYASAPELAADLRRWLQGEPIHARPVGSPERFGRWCRRNPRVAALSVSVIVLLATLAVGSTIAATRIAATLRKLDRERVAGVAARADALLEAAPDAVPFAIESLRQSPETAATLLQNRLRLTSLDSVQQLHAACALAALGDPQPEMLIGSIPSVPPSVGECTNIVAALRHAPPETTTEKLFAAGNVEPDLVLRARYAMVALHLGDPRLAQRLTALSNDPAGRTTFIHAFAIWHGDLGELSQLLRPSMSADLRSAQCLALGLLDPQSVAPRLRQQIALSLDLEFQTAPEAGTHSAAGWALRRWQLPLPTIGPAPAPANAAAWFVNSTGLTMLKIPAGSFVMGDPDERQFRPMHSVTLTRPFYMADREVSVQLYNQFLADPAYDDADKPDPSLHQAPDAAVSTSGQHPIQNVTWVEAILFCNWLSRREGRTPCYERSGEQRVITIERADGQSEVAVWDVWHWNREANGYRLPTEAEWEYACRAGTMSLFYFGNDVELLHLYGSSSNNRVIPARPCGSLIPNGWGLFDMHGNVWEWCWDWFAPMSMLEERDPEGPDEPLAQFGPKRVFRGGGVANFSGDPVSAARGMAPENAAFRNLGFRVACGASN